MFNEPHYIWQSDVFKTIVELPNSTFKQAKSIAARRGMTFEVILLGSD